MDGQRKLRTGKRGFRGGNFLPVSQPGFPARRLRRRAIRQVKFRFFDLWIKFGKIMSKV